LLIVSGARVEEVREGTVRGGDVFESAQFLSLRVDVGGDHLDEEAARRGGEGIGLLVLPRDVSDGAGRMMHRVSE
jgi:hypothetical protein